MQDPFSTEIYYKNNFYFLVVVFFITIVSLIYFYTDRITSPKSEQKNLVAQHEYEPLFRNYVLYLILLLIIIFFLLYFFIPFPPLKTLIPSIFKAYKNTIHKEELHNIDQGINQGSINFEDLDSKEQIIKSLDSKEQITKSLDSKEQITKSTSTDGPINKDTDSTPDVKDLGLKKRLEKIVNKNYQRLAVLVPDEKEKTYVEKVLPSFKEYAKSIKQKTFKELKKIEGTDYTQTNTDFSKEIRHHKTHKGVLKDIIEPSKPSLPSLVEISKPLDSESSTWFTDQSLKGRRLSSRSNIQKDPVHFIDCKEVFDSDVFKNSSEMKWPFKCYLKDSKIEFSLIKKKSVEMIDQFEDLDEFYEFSSLSTNTDKFKKISINDEVEYKKFFIWDPKSSISEKLTSRINYYWKIMSFFDNNTTANILKNKFLIKYPYHSSKAYGVLIDEDAFDICNDFYDLTNLQEKIIDFRDQFLNEIKELKNSKYPINEQAIAVSCHNHETNFKNLKNEYEVLVKEIESKKVLSDSPDLKVQFSLFKTLIFLTEKFINQTENMVEKIESDFQDAIDPNFIRKIKINFSSWLGNFSSWLGNFSSWLGNFSSWLDKNFNSMGSMMSGLLKLLYYLVTSTAYIGYNYNLDLILWLFGNSLIVLTIFKGPLELLVSSIFFIILLICSCGASFKNMAKSLKDTLSFKDEEGNIMAEYPSGGDLNPFGGSFGDSITKSVKVAVNSFIDKTKKGTDHVIDTSNEWIKRIPAFLFKLYCETMFKLISIEFVIILVTWLCFLHIILIGTTLWILTKIILIKSGIFPNWSSPFESRIGFFSLYKNALLLDIWPFRNIKECIKKLCGEETTESDVASEPVEPSGPSKPVEPSGPSKPVELSGPSKPVELSKRSKLTRFEEARPSTSSSSAEIPVPIPREIPDSMSSRVARFMGEKMSSTGSSVVGLFTESLREVKENVGEFCQNIRQTGPTSSEGSDAEGVESPREGAEKEAKPSLKKSGSGSSWVMVNGPSLTPLSEGDQVTLSKKTS